MLTTVFWRIFVSATSCWNRFRKDWVSTWRPRGWLSLDSISSLMMSCWRFSPRPKTQQLSNLIWENALRASTGSVGSFSLSQLYYSIFLQLSFQDDLAITHMSSMDGEVVEFCHSMYPTGNVEDWLLEVETLMRDSMKKVIADSLVNYPLVRLCPYSVLLYLTTTSIGSSYRVGIELAWTSGNCRMSNSMDSRCVWCSREGNPSWTLPNYVGTVEWSSWVSSWQAVQSG